MWMCGRRCPRRGPRLALPVSVWVETLGEQFLTPTGRPETSCGSQGCAHTHGSFCFFLILTRSRQFCCVEHRLPLWRRDGWEISCLHTLEQQDACSGVHFFILKNARKNVVSQHVKGSTAVSQACPPSSMHRVRRHRPASALPSAQGPSLSTPARELPGAGDPAGARPPRRSAPTSRPPSARRGVKRSERLRGRVPDHVALPALFGCPQRPPGPLRGNAGLGWLPPLPATPPRGRSTSRDHRAVA